MSYPSKPVTWAGRNRCGIWPSSSSPKSPNDRRRRPWSTGAAALGRPQRMPLPAPTSAQQALNRDLLGEGGHVDLAVCNHRRHELREVSEAIARRIHRRIPQLAGDIGGIERVQDAGHADCSPRRRRPPRWPK